MDATIRAPVWFSPVARPILSSWRRRCASTDREMPGRLRLEVVEVFGAVQHLADDEQRPPVAERPGGLGDRAVLAVGPHPPIVARSACA